MIRGGLRSRLVLDSVRFAVISTLTQRGWFNATVYDTPPGTRRHLPFRYIARPVEWADDVAPNSFAISTEDVSDDDLAFGGEVEDMHEFYIDIFAQDDSVGWEVTYDIRDSLLGQHPDAVGPQIDIYDFRQATPAPFTVVDIDFLEVDRSQGEARIWQRHWFMIHMLAVDDYSDEGSEATSDAADWTAADSEAWARIQEVEQPVP